MYNVLEKLRAGESLNGKEKGIHEKGLVSVLRQLHDDLDGAVFEAYGWPAGLGDDSILERLVALNGERAEEEKRGVVRWLRPEYQNAEGRMQNAELGKGQGELGISDLKFQIGKKGKGKPSTPSRDGTTNGGLGGSRSDGALGDGRGALAKARTPSRGGSKLVWPSGMAERFRVVEDVLKGMEGAVGAEEMAKRFARAKVEEVGSILETLESMGRARKKGGKYMA